MIADGCAFFHVRQGKMHNMTLILC